MVVSQIGSVGAIGGRVQLVVDFCAGKFGNGMDI